MRRPRYRPMFLAGSLGLAFALGFAGRSHAADDRPLARYIPRQDLLALVEYDGLDAHEAAWKKTAVSKLLNETTLGALLEDLASQGFDKLLASAPPGRKPKGSEVVAAIEELAEKGVAIGIVGKPPEKPGFVVAIRGVATGKLRALYDSAKAATAAVDEKSGKRTFTRMGDASSWFEGDDLIVAESRATTDLVIAAIDGRAQNATGHAIRAELARPEGPFEPAFRAFLDPGLFPPLPAEARAMGLDGIKRIDVRWGFQGDALMSVVRLVAPRPRRGALALFDQPTFTGRALPPLPADLHGFTVVSVDPEVAFGRFVNLMGATDRTIPEKAARFEAQFQRATGLGLREDLLKQLGPKMAIFVKTPEGGAGMPIGPGLMAQIPEVTILAQVDDPIGFGKSIDRLMTLASQAIAAQRRQNPNVPAFEVKKVDGPATAYTLELPPGALPLQGVQPTLFLAKGYLILSSSNESANRLAKVVSGGEKPWAPTGPFAAMSEQLPTGMIALNVSDPRDSLPKLIASLPEIVQALSAAIVPARQRAAQAQGLPPMAGGPLVNVNREMIPDESAMTKLLSPGSFAVAVDDQAIRMVGRSSFPSVSSPASSGVMVALLLPAVQAAREAARRAQCVNNLKQIGLAMHNYHSANDKFPAAAIAGKDGKPLLSWRVAILPYLEQVELYNKFHLDEPWDSPHNRPLISEMPNVYACPSNPGDRKALGLTTYRVFVGGGAAFEPTGPLAIRDFLDGTSNTILAVESREQAVWTKPDDLAFPAEFKKPFPIPGSPHPGGYNALLADGSVRFLKSSIDPQVLRALITRASGEVIKMDALDPR